MFIRILGYNSTEQINLKTGFISRYRNGSCFSPESGQWTCTGAIIVNNMGLVVGSLTLEQLAEKLRNDKAALYHANGKPKFRLTDIDHGTRRSWGELIKSYNIFWVSEAMPDYKARAV